MYAATHTPKRLAINAINIKNAKHAQREHIWIHAKCERYASPSLFV